MQHFYLFFLRKNKQLIDQYGFILFFYFSRREKSGFLEKMLIRDFSIHTLRVQID